MLLFLVIAQSSEARYLNRGMPLNFSRYRLIDLGPTNLSPRCLDRHCWPLSLAPKINKEGEVIGNRGDKGFIWKEGLGFITYPHIGEATCFVDINNHGTILARVRINQDCSDWFLWSEEEWRKGETRAPSLIQNSSCCNSVFLRALNDNSQIIGARVDEMGCYRSIFWNHKKQICDLPYPQLWDINNYNNMLGSEPRVYKEQPLLWHIKGGMAIITDDCRFGKPPCLKHFFNPAIAEDNTVYGNFIASKYGDDYIFSYMWNNDDQIFTPLDLNQMLVSAVNSCHTIVGSLDNEAVISLHHRSPVALASLIDSSLSGWKLLNATDINDSGQIVGFGRRNGMLHLFLLTPIHQAIKY